MLQSLNGQTHKVLSTFSILDPADQNCFSTTTTTKVSFNKLSLKMLQTYAQTPDPLDKAGAYSIQGPGAFLVKAINGSFNNVVGLPIEILITELLKRGLLSL